MGYYVFFEDENLGYTTAGAPSDFWIQNLGADGILNLDDDPKVFINLNNPPDTFFELSQTESKRLLRQAQQAVYVANRNYGKDSYDFEGRRILVDKARVAGEPRCQDFMSPSDCNLMFNVCDPVLCPASRCDLGGAYRVSNVVQTGIIGSVALCLPNLKEGIYVPVCLTGIHAGLDAYVSILKSHRDCLQEQLTTGRVRGICDEIQSVYLCEFFWRQAGPFLDILLQKVIEAPMGQGMKGGGEYLTVKSAFDSLDKSVSYFRDSYAVESVNAFRMRSIAEAGSQFCKMFVSTGYGSGRKIFDSLLQPDSPVQFSAWFDEIPYSEVSVPATSQYKVFYHIYAGKDIGVSYQVYLKSPPESPYIGVQQFVAVQTGFIPKGGYASETRDFTAPAGYKEICVRINGKDECGFKKVSTSFALNYASDKYYEEQLERADITAKSECVSGTSSALALVQTPSVQEGAQGILTPGLEKKGVVRVCSSANPGAGVEPQRWKDVGYCDDEKVRCWLDKKSVQDVIQNKDIEKEVILATNASGKIEQPGTMSVEEVDKKLIWIKGEVSKLWDKIVKVENKSSFVKAILDSIKEGSKVDGTIDVREIINTIRDIEDRGLSNSHKAEALYYKFLIYNHVTDGLRMAKGEGKKEVEQPAPEEKPAGISGKGYELGNDGKIYLNGKDTDLYLRKYSNGFLIRTKGERSVGVIFRGTIRFDKQIPLELEKYRDLEGYSFKDGKFVKETK